MWCKARSSGVAVAVMCVAVVFSTGAVLAESPSELLEKAIYTEETVGDLDAAVKLYEQAVVEAKTVDAVGAKALYRLGLCLLKQKKGEEAEAAFQKLIDTYPDQKEWVTKAKQHVPGQAELKLGEVPWKDGEFMQMGIALGGGLKIGTFVWSVESAKLDGKDIWRMKTHRFVLAGGDNKGVSQVDADKDTFDPIRSTFRHTLLGDVDADYTPGEVVVTTHDKGKTATRKVTLDEVYYDNEQAVELFRRLPLAEGYKATVPIYASFAAGKIDIPIEVTDKETLDVPAGTFECYKLHLGIVNQDFWLSNDANRYLVKFVGAGAVGELQQIGLNKPGETRPYKNERWGFSLALPPGWYVYEQKTPGADDADIAFLLDPEELGTNSVAASKVGEDEAKEVQADAKKALKDWADKKIAERAQALKDYKARPESWQERTVSGLPALSVVADYIYGDQTRQSDYIVFVMGPTTKVELRASSCDPDKLDALRAEFDKIVDTLEIK